MRIHVIGAGPAGLFFALLARRRWPRWDIVVSEQNAADATFGFGVVFSQGALAFLERDAPDFYRALTGRMEIWPIQRIVHRDERVDVDGNGFASIARLRLNQFLQELCSEAGVRMIFGAPVTSLPEADLVVAADGVNSFVRNTLASEFRPDIEWLSNKFAWYGVEKPFDCLTLTFRQNRDGHFVAHHYRYSPTMSTFIVECDAGTWRRAGLDRMDDAASCAYCADVFAPDLDGKPLVSNKSVWRSFPLLTNANWRSGNVVLIGDALRTGHFSVGSGTRLALEDAIALDKALAVAGEDVQQALERFEAQRRPVVEKIVAAARQSSYWYERLAEKMQLPPWQLAYDYMTRSGRMDDARLASIAPAFMARRPMAAAR
ncbi:MAG: FAD-dependent monooxygenase [Burkholderiales bacterium]